MAIKPIGNGVVVKILDTGTQQSDIIISVEQKHLHPNRDALVLAVGPGKVSTTGKRLPMTVKVGDKVQINGICGVGENGKEGKYAEGDEIVITEDDIYFIY